MSETVIKIENIYKEYKLGVISHGTLHRDLQSWWARLRGKEDPNSLISLHHKKETEDESFLALNNVSFNVKKGEILGIIGKNGAGKSTILKIISKITSPSGGEIKIKGRIGSLLEVGTGFHPELTGRENIYLNGAILGMSKTEIRSKIDEIINFAGIEKHIDTPVKRYSSGMYVRLAFSVAAHLDPEILIVDEVLAVGDAAFQKKCLGKMKEISKGQGRTVLFVSHNMTSIESLCTSCILLESGKVVLKDSTGIVISKYLELKSNSSKSKDLKNRKDRVEGYLFRFTKFNIFNSQKKSIDSVTCGSYASFELSFEITLKELQNLRIGIIVYDKNHDQMITFWNSYYGSTESYTGYSGVNKFKFDVNKINLSPGQYSLDFIATSGLDLCDWIKDAYQLTVDEGLFYESGQMPQPGHNPLFFSEYNCQYIRNSI